MNYDFHYGEVDGFPANEKISAVTPEYLQTGSNLTPILHGL
jgi:hypothetical protein